jgi:DNA-binding response OmpR family regulator
MQVTIIEDDAMVSEVLRIALEAKGFGVTVCPEQALAEVCSSQPDVLVVDMGTPFELGSQFCQQILRRLPECCVLPMTGGLEHADDVIFADGSSAHVFQKPFSLHTLLDQIESFAAQRRQHSLVSLRSSNDSASKLRHDMRNIAMVVCGSATLLHDAAEGDATLLEIADKVGRLSHRGLDEVTLPLLQECCRAAIGKAGDNMYFKKNVERILGACARGIKTLSATAQLFHARSDGVNVLPESCREMMSV